jgi:large subunit ribosomal protein L28
MAKCENCGKAPSFGHNVSHSHVKTKRRWKPNIQKVTVHQDGMPKRMKLCTRCIRTMHKMR